MVTLSRSSSVRDRQCHDVARRLGLGLRLRNLSMCCRREVLIVDGARVALDFLERAVAAHRLDLVCAALALGHDAAPALAQPMRHTTVGQSGCGYLLAEPSVEALLAERPAPLVDQKRQRFGRARTSLDRSNDRRWQWRLDLHRLVLAVL